MRKQLIFLLIAILMLARAYAQPLSYPTTHTVPQVDNYHGKPVADPYRWLENDTAPAVANWVQAENKVTQAYLQTIPYRSQLLARLKALTNYPRYGVPVQKGGMLFYTQNPGLLNQSILYVLRPGQAREAVLLDPNQLAADGTTRLVNYEPTKDGSYVGIALSAAGSDWQELGVIESATGRRLPDRIRWAKFTRTTWRGNAGFYYGRFPTPTDTAKAYSNKNEGMQLYFHKLGTDQAMDELVYEDAAHPQRFPGVGLSEHERYLALLISDPSTGAR